MKTWIVVFVHVLGGSPMHVASEGAFADRLSCERRVAVLNQRERGQWYHACAEVV